MDFLTVVIPACNEEDNIKRIEKELLPVMNAMKIKKELLIIDDGSTDGTADEARKLMKKHDFIRMVQHEGNRGLGAATMTAINNANGNIMIFLDADFTFHPSEMPKLYKRFKETNCDCVVGAHFGGGSNTLSPKRYMLSKGVNTLYQVMLGKRMTTTSSIFRLYRTEQLRQLKLSSKAFSICAEILFKLVLDKRKIEEVPVTLTTRIYGESKIRNARETKNHLKMLASVGLWRIKHMLGARYA
jgi:dolichol-phosphate mannosyltransferase